MKNKYQLEELYLLVITAPKNKKEIIADMLERFEVTCNASVLAKGAMDNSKNREVIFSIIRKSKIKDALLALEDKFRKFTSKVSMAYAIPLKKIIGVSNYMFLSNGGNK